jgi:hypothetical protein
MSTKIDESTQKGSFGTIASKEFDEFERQDHEIRMEERSERAMQLGLPTALAQVLIK